MSTITWFPGITLALDPDAIEDYALDFTEWLNDDMLQGVIAVDASNCVAEIIGSKLRVSAVENAASVQLTLQTTNGRRNDFTIRFEPFEQ